MEVCFNRQSFDGEWSSSHCVPHECLKRESLKKSHIYANEQLGAGRNGTIYKVNDDRVLKVVSLTKSTINDFDEDEKSYIRDDMTDENDEDGVNLAKFRLKHMEWYSQDESNNFKDEVEMAKLADIFGIGPKVYDSWRCKDVRLTYHHNDLSSKPMMDELGFILMERVYGMTLRDYVRYHSHDYNKNESMIFDMLATKLQTLNDNGYIYGDLHKGNIMVSFDKHNKVSNVLFVDFGGMFKSVDPAHMAQNVEILKRDSFS